MNQALLYSKYNGIQKSDASFVLNNYIRLIRWKTEGGDSILDIGCGAGDVTNELLLPLLPENFGRIVGADVSEDMVDFATAKCSHPKASFVQMNIASPDISVDFEEEFDHIFSFYCLHWIQNQRQAMENIHRMLKPGGDILLAFLASNPIFDIYQKLSQTGRWEAYMDNFKSYMSPYQYSPDPGFEFGKLLKEVGFRGNLSHVEERIYVYPNVAVLKKSITAVSPFYSRIPANMQDEYLTDYVTEARRLKLVENSNNNEERIQVPYKLFVVYATK